jgi:hypothetical protein
MRLFFILLMGFVAQANAEIFKCVEDGGRITYSNSQTKDCTRLNVGPPNTVPAPKSATSAAANGFPRVKPDQQKTRDDERRRILDLELANEEKAMEAAQNALADQEQLVLPEERNAGGRGVNGEKVAARIQPFRDRIALHQRNIEALRREIANLR